MTADQIRSLDIRIRNHMIVNHQLTQQEVTAALETRDDLPDLANKLVVSNIDSPMASSQSENLISS
jgi:hypothetical protein